MAVCGAAGQAPCAGVWKGFGEGVAPRFPMQCGSSSPSRFVFIKVKLQKLWSQPLPLWGRLLLRCPGSLQPSLGAARGAACTHWPSLARIPAAAVPVPGRAGSRLSTKRFILEGGNEKTPDLLFQSLRLQGDWC